ncbi:MAG: haloacid dehalogenase [Sphingomonadales bacterium CG12_big_fil_rev_8_21_14_0_65_65_10]|uniref:HAD-IA family hydrolase n=1 Tax=Blastomonas marina TaxID=1867408 RepID=UPI000CAF1128|nr:HAD-IA family hydrolase [Blastomonas marina]PIW56152.1 MAG: haloacid dehalogenase [Sphingomonadales bacterium CG12_big_fil_rev_8_21_14_0_65_65_10]WPZ02869.1 HAD-IA family hydrolase [Blastomonas marina]
MSDVVRLAVFDCDGTLVDGQAAVVEAMAAACSALGEPLPDPNHTRRSVGLSLPSAMLSLFPDAGATRRDALVEAYKDAFRAARERNAVVEPLYDGIAELLTELHAGGWQLAVATGKSMRGLKHTLETHGLSDLFSSLQTADRNPSKPDPAMLRNAMDDCLAHSCVMIGDTSYDMAMARQIGARAIGVDWGYHAPDELIDAGAERVVADTNELKELLDG